jgi:hypothetical protein
VVLTFEALGLTIDDLASGFTFLGNDLLPGPLLLSLLFCLAGFLLLGSNVRMLVFLGKLWCACWHR